MPSSFIVGGATARHPRRAAPCRAADVDMQTYLNNLSLSLSLSVYVYIYTYIYIYIYMNDLQTTGTGTWKAFREHMRNMISYCIITE